MRGVSRKGKKRKRKKPELENPAQSARFIEAAKALGVEENGAAFERAMDALLPKKPAKRKDGG
jgi:hypothetical protein